MCMVCMCRWCADVHGVHVQMVCMVCRCADGVQMGCLVQMVSMAGVPIMAMHGVHGAGSAACAVKWLRWRVRASAKGGQEVVTEGWRAWTAGGAGEGGGGQAGRLEARRANEQAVVHALLAAQQPRMAGTLAHSCRPSLAAMASIAMASQLVLTLWRSRRYRCPRERVHLRLRIDVCRARQCALVTGSPSRTPLALAKCSSLRSDSSAPSSFARCLQRAARPLIHGHWAVCLGGALCVLA
jgi:hypothetical protein